MKSLCCVRRQLTLKRRSFLALNSTEAQTLRWNPVVQLTVKCGGFDRSRREHCHRGHDLSHVMSVEINKNTPRFRERHLSPQKAAANGAI